jgi:acetolactate synthase-1/2/3 large subunit
VKVIIINNHYLGMVRQWQQFFYNKNYSYTCMARTKDCPVECNEPGKQCPNFIPDFVKLAEAYGAMGIRVTKKAEVIPALRKALRTPRTVFVECIVEKEENVFPMIPAGASVRQMMGGMA